MSINNLSSELKSAIIRSLLGKYSVYIVQLLSLIILARMFTPSEFGVVAIAVIFLTFFQVISTSGMAPSIVYLKNISAFERDSLFSFGIVIGLCSSFIYLLIINPALVFFELSEYFYYFLIFSVSIVFLFSSYLPLGVLNKHSRFDLVARSEIFSEVLSFIVCFVLFFFGFGLFSLFSKFATVPVFRFFLYLFYNKKAEFGLPAIVFDFRARDLIYDFVKYQVQFNILNFFSRNLDNILVAKFFGIYSLGLYEKIYQIMRYPLQLFTFAINPALQPVLTKQKDNPDMVFKEYNNVISKLSIIGLFCSAVFVFASKDIIYIVFGDQWIDAAPLLSILSVSISVQMVLSSTGGVFQAFGQTKALLSCGVFSFFTSSICILLGVTIGDLYYMCYFLVFAFFVNFIQCFYVLRRNVFNGVSGYLSSLVFRFIVVVIPVFFLLFYDGDIPILSGFWASVLNVLIVALCACFLSVLLYFFENKFLYKIGEGL